MIDAFGSPQSYKPMGAQYGEYVGAPSPANPYVPQSQGRTVRPPPGSVPFPSSSNFGTPQPLATPQNNGNPVDQGFLSGGGFNLGYGFQNLPGGGLNFLRGIGSQGSNYAPVSTTPYTNTTPFSTVQNDFNNTLQNLNNWQYSNPGGNVWAGGNNGIFYGNPYQNVPGGNATDWLTQLYNQVYGNYAKMGAFGGPGAQPIQGGR